MDNQLETIREIWISAFFTGDYDVLRQYEHDHFKVVYEEDGRVEGNYTRYDRIAHAVNNGVWKPQKLDIDIEEYTYNREQTECEILLGLEDRPHYIREIWQDTDNGWQIIELRFLKTQAVETEESTCG